MLWIWKLRQSSLRPAAVDTEGCQSISMLATQMLKVDLMAWLKWCWPHATDYIWYQWRRSAIWCTKIQCQCQLQNIQNAWGPCGRQRSVLGHLWVKSRQFHLMNYWRRMMRGRRKARASKLKAQGTNKTASQSVSKVWWGTGSESTWRAELCKLTCTSE